MTAAGVIPTTIGIWLIACLACMAGGWSAKDADGRIEGWFGGELQSAWQHALIENPRGGARFRNNAYFHPLSTPSGFVWTDAQPGDHAHHSGVWWPWKYVEVEGRRYITWEIQRGQGAHVSRAVHLRNGGPAFLEWELHNETVIRKPGRDAGPPVADGIPVIREIARVRIARHGAKANVIDFWIDQFPLVDSPVRLPKHRYSGFTWRGPKAWNAGASKIITSDGHTRRNADGQPARWVLVTGSTPAGGEASVLIMSAAVDLAGVPERLRVWNAWIHGGVPFINFNPLAERALTLNPESPAAAKRHYRIVAADATLTATEAENFWQSWRIDPNSKVEIRMPADLTPKH